MNRNSIVALENIRSLHNVGAIIRTAEFFGISQIALIGYTALDDSEPDQLNSKLKKTALSSLSKVKIIKYDTTAELLQDFKEYKLVCIENNVPNTTPLDSWIPKGSLIILFGNEVNGVENETLEKSSIIVEIPRIGEHPSLNVATTAGIILYKLTEEKPKQ